MNTFTIKDPKQLLDEEIDEAFVEEQVIRESEKPATGRFGMKELLDERQRLGVIAIALGAGAAFSIAASFTTVLVAHRFRAPQAHVLLGKWSRHYGYGRFRLGRWGRAYMAYTYKLPELRLQLPQVMYKLPTVHVKLPTHSPNRSLCR